jgi:hypothetical protein
MCGILAVGGTEGTGDTACNPKFTPNDVGGPAEPLVGE